MRTGGTRGFSLFELVVALAIVATLAALAQPAYRRLLLRAQRTEAASALMQIAAMQERYHLQHQAYASALEAAPPAGLGLKVTSAEGRYTLAIIAADANGFVAVATAQGSQAEDVGCASFTLDESGTKSSTGSDCWPR
jgi:prepilin-type N-terminal cleavage/methylation domain-containing protein